VHLRIHRRNRRLHHRLKRLPHRPNRLRLHLHLLLRLNLGSHRLGRLRRSLFPPHPRKRYRSLHSFKLALEFVIGFCTPYIVDPEHANSGSKVFFIWGGTCAACIVFAALCVDETKGLSLEQIDAMVKEVAPMSSSKWRPHGEMLPPPAVRETSGVLQI
jgi:hypothetical protein